MAKKGFDPKKLLEEFGWEKGKGLGKTENGMKEAIKVKLKMDTTGVGHDAGEQFTFHWWDHVFNNAAKSIEVNKTEGSVHLKKTGESTEISTKKHKLSLTDKSMLYGSFVKSATLENGVEEKESESNSESEGDVDANKSFSGLTDEQLFEACGSRTAHKGARHGLKLNGKLARIAQQEQRSAANSASESTPAPRQTTLGNSEDTVDSANNERTPKKHKKKKSKKSKDLDDERSKLLKKETNCNKKKRKREHEKADESTCNSENLPAEVAHLEPNSTTVDELNKREHSNSCKKKRKKDSNRKDEVPDLRDCTPNNQEEKNKSTKKKKKMKSSKYNDL